MPSTPGWSEPKAGFATPGIDLCGRTRDRSPKPADAGSTRATGTGP